MKHKSITAIILIIVMVLSAVAMTGCSDDLSPSVPINEGDFKLPDAPGDTVLGNDCASMDISNKDDGYVSIKYKGDCDKVKLQIIKGSDTYTYDLNDLDNYKVFPFTCGNGTYKIEVYENIAGNQYALACAESVNVNLKDENSPFMYPNAYVDYDMDSDVVKLTYKVTENSDSQLTVVSDVYDWVVRNIDYDNDLAANVQPGYIPVLNDVIATKKGICFDYASLMSAMLRIRNIPTKLVVGYSGDVYHAWISVYISEIGWVENVIEFDGTDWTLMDPTFASSGGSDAQADYVKNKDKYHALYFY